MKYEVSYVFIDEDELEQGAHFYPLMPTKDPHEALIIFKSCIANTVDSLSLKRLSVKVIKI